MNLKSLMNRELKIALDVDGVLADVIAPWLEHNNRVRSEILRHDVDDWDFWKKFNINQHDFYAELNRCWENWIDIPPTEDNLSDSTMKLSQIGQVDIVTARERYTDFFVKSWLMHHGIMFENYISVISGSMKADLDYDVFIDDSPRNAMKIIQNKKRMILYSQTWNQNVNDDKILRVSSLSEVLEVLG